MSNRFKNTLYTLGDYKHVDGHIRYVTNEDGAPCFPATIKQKSSLRIYQGGICTAATTSASDTCPPKASPTWCTFPAGSAIIT